MSTTPQTGTYAYTDINGTEIRIGDKVKSFDSQFHDLTYIIGTVTNRAPAPAEVCPCGGDHIWIQTEKRVNNHAGYTDPISHMVYPACVEPYLGGARLEKIE